MSFSSDVKTEILLNKNMLKHHRDALAYGLFLHCKKYSEKAISLTTSQSEIATLFQKLADEILAEPAETKISVSFKKEAMTEIKMTNKNQVVCLVEYFAKKTANFLLDDREKYAFLAGAFLSCGSVSHPQSGYHLEFTTPNFDIGNSFAQLFVEIFPKLGTTIRRNRFVIYFKEVSQVIDILTMMGANNAVFTVIDTEMMKDIRNNVNRRTNCETANISKTVMAATSQIMDIELVLKTLGKKNIPENLLETARIRTENPYSSLRELAKLFDPPISRSGLHHRLSALSSMAEDIRNNQEVKKNV